VSSGNYLLAALLAFTYMYAFIGLNRQSMQMVFGESAGNMVSTPLVSGGHGTVNSSIINEPRSKEDRISIIIPAINLTVSLIIGVYMIPTLVQAAVSLGL
jgi:hypothetical protein